MCAYKLRPHHGLCAGFFRGKGYDAAFTENMTAVVAALGADPAVELICACDVLCARCPHGESGVCDAARKVDRYDRAVLSLCGLSDGQKLPWSRFRAAVEEKILRPGDLEAVCGDCEWFSFCKTLERPAEQ